MPAYVIPQVEVFQDFQTSPAAVANALQAHITGPHAYLLRYADEDERPLGLLGYYDNVDEQSYDWPHRPAGGQVDNSAVKLFAENAILRYFQGSAGGAGGVTKVAGSRNRVRSAATNWITYSTFDRDADLFDRDVKVGDVVKLRFPNDGDPITMWSYVNGFIGEAVDAVIAAATADSNNAATDSVDVSFSQTRGPFNAATITAASAAAYNPFSTGKITETYTIIVTGSSVNGDYTTAELRVLSASGLDDVASVTPSAQGVPTAIGALGATVTFDNTASTDMSESAEDAGLSPNDLLVGQRFEVTVTADFTAIVAPTSAGDYAASASTTYIVEVVKGAKYASGVPQIKVTTTTGVDLSGPTNVTAAAIAVPIGTQGVTVTFAGLGLVKGDRYYVEVTAAGTGARKTIVLGNTIPADIGDGDEADITLYIRQPLLEISKNRADDAPLVNFDVSATEITVYSGITTFDPTWTDDGEPLALELESDSGQGYGKLYVEYRAWVQALCNEVGTIGDVGELNGLIAGPLDPANPLKWGIFKALSNSNGVPVKYTSVCNPDDTDSWTNVLELLLGRDDVYGLVPLTRDATIQNLFAAHVAGQSTPLQGLWRTAWFNLAGVPEIPVVHAGSSISGHTAATTSDGEVCLATITDNPDDDGTQYTLLVVPAGNGNFITNAVRAGDIVRTLYTSDGFGNTEYQEFVVDDVLTEESLRLLAGPTAPINVAAKIEVWRNLTPTEEATAIGQVAGAFASRRVRAVWPDTIETAGTIQEGYHLCAALAGLRSGVFPHQGLTNLEIAGFDGVPRTTKKFNKPQLDIMAGSGVWIVTQSQTGEVFTRHAVTTGSYDDINQREEVLTSNVDSISYRFKDTFAPFIGIANVTPSLLALLRLEIIALIDTLKSEKFTTMLGGQLIDAQIIDLRQHLTLKDRVVLILNLVLPYPFNNFEVHLLVPTATTTQVPSTESPGATTPTTTG